jgi:hypothetical protein
MEATDSSEAQISEAFVNFYQTMKYHIPGYNNLHSFCHEILKNLCIKNEYYSNKILKFSTNFLFVVYFTTLSAISIVQRQVASIQNALRC